MKMGISFPLFLTWTRHDHGTQIVIYEASFKLSHVGWNEFCPTIIFFNLCWYWRFLILNFSRTWSIQRMAFPVDGIEILALFKRLDLLLKRHERLNFFRCNYSCLDTFLKKSPRLEYVSSNSTWSHQWNPNLNFHI